MKFTRFFIGQHSIKQREFYVHRRVRVQSCFNIGQIYANIIQLIKHAVLTELVQTGRFEDSQFLIVNYLQMLLFRVLMQNFFV